MAAVIYRRHQREKVRGRRSNEGEEEVERIEESKVKWQTGSGVAAASWSRDTRRSSR